MQVLSILGGLVGVVYLKQKNDRLITKKLLICSELASPPLFRDSRPPQGTSARGSAQLQQNWARSIERAHRLDDWVAADSELEGTEA
eukprot:487603-Amphidinium_carterae.1